MNKRINFEDTLFILNVRIRMIRDLMRLDTDSGLFYNQTMSDLEFISAILDMPTARFLENLKILDREVEADNIFDAEWQFSQLLNEISNNTSPFAPSLFPETPIVVSKLKTDSVKRKKLIDDSYVPAESIVTEQVVTNEELNGLLGSSA